MVQSYNLKTRKKEVFFKVLGRLKTWINPDKEINCVKQNLLWKTRHFTLK